MKATRIAQVIGWLLLLAAIFLTLGPPTFRPATGVEHNLEHFLAFALIGLMFGLGYPGHRLAAAVNGVIIVALLEALQLWAPGRHASFTDLVDNAIGLCVGLTAAAVLQWIRLRRGS